MPETRIAELIYGVGFHNVKVGDDHEVDTSKWVIMRSTHGVAAAMLHCPHHMAGRATAVRLGLGLGLGIRIRVRVWSHGLG